MPTLEGQVNYNLFLNFVLFTLGPQGHPMSTGKENNAPKIFCQYKEKSHLKLYKLWSKQFSAIGV